MNVTELKAKAEVNEWWVLWVYQAAIPIIYILWNKILNAVSAFGAHFGAHCI